MRINYGDSGLIVNYIQMFLKEYYSKYIDIEYEYSKNVQENLIRYMDSPDSVDTYTMMRDLSDFRNNPEIEFKISDTINEIIMTAKMPNTNGYPTDDTAAVAWLDNVLTRYSDRTDETFGEFLYSKGWHIANISYRNLDNKCEVIIQKTNKSVLPKDALHDLINMYDSKYIEQSFAESSDANKYYFSSLYNFEIKNYDTNQEEFVIEIPSSFSDYQYTVQRNSNGTYDILKNGVIIENNFRGFKTFVTNKYIKTGQYYAFYLKKPENYKFDPDTNRFVAYLCYSKDIGKRFNVDYTNQSNMESVRVIDFSDISDEKYLCIVTKIELPTNGQGIVDGDYKACITFYDPDNEIDSILAYRLDENSMKESFKNSITSDSCRIIYPDNTQFISDNFNISIITPEDYYSNPYAIHEKLLSYILESVVHEFSRENDIILVQKLAAKMGFFLNEHNLGIYTTDFKEFIANIQKNFPDKNGDLVEYGKGYVDPDTEAIMNLYNAYKLGDDD